MATNQAETESRPLLVYDRECGLCRMWVEYWKQQTGDAVRYAAFQEEAEPLPQIPSESFEKSIHFIAEDGGVLSGAHAIYKTLSYAPRKGFWLWLYRFVPGFAWLTERVSGFVLARSSTTSGRVATWLWGRSLEASNYRLVSGLFLRLLALIYLVAFVSIGVQIVGLAGSGGILPFHEELRYLGEDLGSEAYWRYPTLFWINASDAALQAVAIAGCIFSVLLFLNLLPRVSLILLFLCYLSLFQAGQLLMNFQWDYLLLEAGFLAIFLLSGSRIVIWLFRWLLFRFRFLSGASKLLSDDPSWANLTALNHYFETQPLPHWVSWYVHQLPDGFLRFCTGSALAIELLVPFMMFLPRGPRFVAAWLTLLMQGSILLTSNHNFFNLLTIVLCLFLFDDRAVSRVIPRSAAGWLTGRGPRALTGRSLHTLGLGALAGLIVFISGFQMWEMFNKRPSPEPVATAMRGLQPFRIVNKYHVFPTMNTERVEIIIEGSLDGERWEAYEFRYKPGDPGRRPEVLIPHQPRLDWMMWFVPQGHPLLMMWYDAFLYRLLENAPPVVELLETNPFSGQPPKYLRASLYRYRFTNPESRAATGQWWEREYLGPFYPWPWLVRDTPPG